MSKKVKDLPAGKKATSVKGGQGRRQEQEDK